MRIMIDIKHPAQLNLFKGLSNELRAENWEVTICYLQRGKLQRIIEKEYESFHTIPVGSSSGTKWSIIWNGNIKRTLTFLQLFRKNKYDICIAASSIPLAVAGHLFKIPVLQFYDDPERRQINLINARFSSQLFFPPIVAIDHKTSVFNCLKEWSYLSPKRFTPNISVLSKYDLTAHEYIFIREVSNKSFNYFKQRDGLVAAISNAINKNIKVLLSLEDKSRSALYPSHWTELQEPVEDIHSLLYYSKLVVSSGDSMAREGAMLGIPSVYCGIREMKANNLLIACGTLNHLQANPAVSFINETIQKPFDDAAQQAVRNHLLENWDDMISFMKEKINQYKTANK